MGPLPGAAGRRGSTVGDDGCGAARLFGVPGGRNVPLERISVTALPTGVNLWFRVIR